MRLHKDARTAKSLNSYMVVSELSRLSRMMVTDMLEGENEMIRSAFTDANECLSNEDVKDKRLRLGLQICGDTLYAEAMSRTSV